jgi:nucleotide-binding universal stress UspA family protein
MSEHSQVVVGYDFSGSGHAALERAITLAQRAPWHVLHIVCVIDPRMAFPAVPAKHVDVAYANRVVAAITVEVATALGSDPEIQFFVHAPIAKTAVRSILEVAEAVSAELIIVGCKGITGLERALVGSTSEQIVREAGCTVEVARPNRYLDRAVPPTRASL